MRKGHESYFEEDEVLQEVLEQYLTFLEDECKLESDWCYDRGDKQLRPWGPPSPFNSHAYVTQCRKEWSEYWKKKDDMEKARGFLPVKQNHVLSGVPLHFSTPDLKEIRKDLVACVPVQEYFHLPMDEVMFFVCAKVFAMPSSVASVWVFVGAEVPLSPAKIKEIAEIEIEKDLADSDSDAEFN